MSCLQHQNCVLSDRLTHTKRTEAQNQLYYEIQYILENVFDAFREIREGRTSYGKKKESTGSERLMKKELNKMIK